MKNELIGLATVFKYFILGTAIVFAAIGLFLGIVLLASHILYGI